MSAETLSLLISKGLSGDELVEVVRAIDADHAVQKPVRTLRQERNHRYYEKRKASENVLIQTSEQDVLIPPSPPPKRYNQTPSLSPIPSLRSGNSARSSDFDRFYAPFPKHVNPDAAKRKLQALVKSGIDIEDIVAGVKRYAASVAGTEARFVQAPDVWLNKGRWKDGISPAAQPCFDLKTVWVSKDSDEGRAWWEHTFRRTGKYPPTDKEGGWRFPSQFPPAEEAAE